MLAAMTPTLPIDPLLPTLVCALTTANTAILVAPPGSGKTTRVPLALRDAGLLGQERVLLLEPRRLAARHAAAFMARCLGEEVGQTVGYSIRHERRVSTATRIEVVTEGILTRRLQADPGLDGVGLVIFDEFHERHLTTDLALALCREVQGLRPELRLLVMSATLDTTPLARLLGDCPVLEGEGRPYPVELRYLPPARQERLEDAAARTVRQALPQAEGDLLVFLPGAGEIRRVEQRLADLTGVDICPLHGGLPFDRQRRAVEPGPRRRVVLATNIAETSLTIEGVRLVIDSGYERRPRFAPGSGLTRLELRRISCASADQRAGRAGRLGPGLCLRLWSEGEQGALLPQAPPEIRSADLAPLALELAAWGVTDAATLPWLDPPPATTLQAGRQLLTALAALDADGRVTPLGRAMVRLPLHPRLARLLCAAGDDDPAALPLACELAALLAERPILPRRSPAAAADCDLQALWQAYDRWSRGQGGHDIDDAACRAVARVVTDLQRQVDAVTAGRPRWRPQVTEWLALAWPDRVGRRREGTEARYLLANGSGATLGRFSAVPRPEYLVALDLDGEGEPQIQQASVLEVERLRQLFAGQIRRQRQVAWSTDGRRIDSAEEERLGALVLSRRSVPAEPADRLAAALAGVRTLGLDRLGWSAEGWQLWARLQRMHTLDPGWPDVAPAALLAKLEQWLAPWLTQVRSRQELERLDPLPALQALVGWERLRQLDSLLPPRCAVPSGSRYRIDYTVEGDPVLAVKLQETFGWASSPQLAGGRVPLVLHLLSPAGRPLAVTRDLRFFWDEVYPQVKKEMKGRYPKHPWPDDPWTAEATRRTKRRPG